MSNTLIIGGSRGIGLELCQQMADRGENVITTCRESTERLAELAVQVIPEIDVTNPHDIETLKRHLGDTQIDTLIHNSGVLKVESLNDMNFDSIELQFRVNTLGPLRVIHALLGNLQAGSKIGILSSRMGSIADNLSGGYYGYRISKAGVNALGISLTRDLESSGIAVALLHPGLVATDMTDGKGTAPADSAKSLIEIMDQVEMSNSGTFWHAKGYELPW